MIKRKKYFISLIFSFLVLIFGGMLFAPVFQQAKDFAHAEIMTGATGFVPSRNKAEETVYHLFQTQNYELTAGKEIMFVAGKNLENTMVVPSIPAGSAKLKVTSSGKAYNTTNITCYVDVVERGNGFDSCLSGTLNENATEYNCCYGGVQHYYGASFNYSTKVYYNTARVGVFDNNVAMTNATVKLYDGETYYSLNSENNGYYSNNQIFNGEYEIIVNGKHTGQPLIINKFTIGSDGYLSGGAFYSGNTYNENVYFYSMEVKTYLDGSLSNAPGEVYLKSSLTNCSLSRVSTGVYKIEYIMRKSSRRETYSVVVGGLNTGYVLNDEVNSNFRNSVSVYYYTLSASITADSAWTNAKVELRNDNGEVRSVLSYRSTSGNTTLYTNIMQKDESASPEKMTVYVDYVATDKTIYSVRQGSVGSSDDKTFANLTYYDARVNLRLDNAALTAAYPVTISNGVNSYSMTNSNGILTLRVRQVMSNNQELPYKVIVSGGVTDNLAPLTITASNKTITYNYFTVKFYTYSINGSTATASVYRTQYVRSGSKPSLVSDPYVAGMTFDKWSLTTWSQNENLDSITEYNFSNAITSARNIYPHFAKTEVKINESFIKCSVSGTQSSKGVAFRMANVTISGFDKGNSSIKSILLNLKNVETVYFYSTSGKTYKQGQNQNLTTISGGYSASQSAVSITFNSKVSMASAQDYIRNYIVIKPVVNQDVQVNLTVSDGVLSTNATTSVSQSQWNGTSWTVKSAGTYNSWWIGSSQGVQYVYFSGNCTFNGNINGWGGLEIYGTCYMYIPKGVTITCNGVAGDGSRQGGAGIYVPEGSNLYVLGEGTLVANGGRAGNGSNGSSGGNASKNGSQYTSGSGGAGGVGGGGAGAGIGSHGAPGGSGGAGGAGGTVTWSNKGKAQFTGKTGNAGSAGQTPASAGNLYKTSSVSIKAYGGSAGANGSGAGAGGYQTDSGTGWKYNHCAAGGGGGGGGGAGYAGNGIGSGGAGGGGGGGGGSGACDYHSGTDYNCIGGGQGGYGGYGASGQAGRGGNAHCDHQDIPGGGGGGGGASGNSGSSKSATTFNISTNTNTKWSVTFTGATSNGTQYYSFESTTITAPDYVPSGKKLFLGWKVSTYAKNAYGGASSRPLTTTENNLYQPGTAIKTALGTYGNIVLTAVTMPYDGKIAQDKLNVAKKYFASTSPTNPTYYTYAIQAYLDSKKANVGTMSFTINGKVYKVESSASSAGLYSLTLETNVSTFTAKLDGVSVSGTLNKGTNSVYFETMKVKTTGNNLVKTVALSGSSALILQKDESASSGSTIVYSAVKQKNLDTNSYTIIVDGETIPTSMAVAKFGTTATVPYSKVTVSVNTNMTIESVELVDGNNNSIPLNKENGSWSTTQLQDAKTDYSVYVNGFDTKVTTKFNAATKSLTAKIFEFKLVTRINGVVSPSIAKLTVNGNSTTMKIGESKAKGPSESNEYWSYVVIDNTSVSVESNGTCVATVVPSSNLDKTYIDYYTVQYDAGSATGDVPVDDNIYLAGEKATILSQNQLSVNSENQYLAGWTTGSNIYTEGDEATISGPLTLTAILTNDLLKVHYVDYFGELEVKSRLELKEKLVAYDGENAVQTFNDFGRVYTLKGWVLDVDSSKTIYSSGEITKIVAGDILGNGVNEVNVYFNAVYEIDYLSGIHFELELTEEDEDGLKILGHIGDTFTINYRVKVNDGVSALLLLPKFNKNIFAINAVSCNNATILGEGTTTANLESDLFKIVFENTKLFNETDDVLFSIEYVVKNNIAGKYSDFGLILNYPEDTTQTVNNLTRSNAWYILTEEESSAFHCEVEVCVDNEIAVIIQTEATITIENQTVVYHGEGLTAGNIYILAESFDESQTYYEFIDGEFVLNSGATANNFYDKHYYIANSLNDVLYDYSAYGQQVNCVLPAEFTIKWYSYDSLTDTYTEIDAPKNVGDYYVGVSATRNDFAFSVDEVKQLIHIVKADITYTIHDKTSVWSEELAVLSGEISGGNVYGDDDLNIELETTATSDSNVGNYTIAGTFNNTNYNVSFENGTYTITKLQIELGLDATAKFEDKSFAYNGEERTICVNVANFYQDILQVTYTGGEAGCSGNGAINVRYNEDNEVIGYMVTASFTITANYIQNCEFVKDAFNNSLNTLSAELTITVHGLSKQEVDELVQNFVRFSVEDGQNSIILTPTNNEMSYNRKYNGVYEYSKIVVATEKDNVKNDKISPIVTYKLNETESVQIDTRNQFDYTDYSFKDANVYVVQFTIVPGNGYAFEADVDPVYVVTMTIEKQGLTINATAEVSYLDSAPTITIGDGTNAWIENENYETYGIDDIQNFAYLVCSTYQSGNNAGTLYDLSWSDEIEVGNGTKTAEEILSEILYNYELTLTTTNENVVAKRVINVDDYEYNGYSAIYDGNEHSLQILNNDAVVNLNDELISYTILLGEVEKGIVKSVGDCGNYVATITLKDTDNYIFSESLNSSWVLNATNTSATATREVSIVPKLLTVEVVYTTKSLITLSLTGFVDGESEIDLTNFTYLCEGTAIENTITATTSGQFEVTAQSDCENYSFTQYTVAVYEVSFVSGKYSESVAGVSETPQGIPNSQYIFSGIDADTFDVEEEKGVFKADLPENNPTLRHYTFKLWSSDGEVESEFDFDETIIQDDVVIYAFWNKNQTYTITYKYKVDNGTTWNDYATDTFYTDDKLVYGGTLQNLQKDWFTTDIWYLDEALTNKLANKTYLSSNTTLYGHYIFDIGVGDVNADGSVNANDITLYRKWIVGGYEMIVVETGNEWTTVNSEEFDLEHNIYFVKRVADSNAQTSSSTVLGDGHLDIRDVSTIRMALVGGYGFDVACGVETTNDSVVIVSVSEIDNISKLLLTICSGKKAKLSKDIDEDSAIVDIENLKKNIVIDLNGMTITVPSFSLELADDFEGKVEIANGTIITTDGLSLSAPKGRIVLRNVTLFDENGNFTLLAENNDFQIEGDVNFLRDDGSGNQIEVEVNIP